MKSAKNKKSVGFDLESSKEWAQGDTPTTKGQTRKSEAPGET